MSFGGLLGSLYGDLPAPKRFSSSSSSTSSSHSSSSSAAAGAADAATHNLGPPAAAGAAEAFANHQLSNSLSTDTKQRDESRYSPGFGAANSPTTLNSSLATSVSSSAPTAAAQQPPEASTVAHQPLVWTNDKASLLLLQPISRKQKKATSRDASSKPSATSALASSSLSSLSSSKPGSSCSGSISNTTSLSSFGTAAISASSAEIEGDLYTYAYYIL